MERETAKNTDNKEQQTPNFVTVIPVEYRNRVYTSQNPDYIVAADQFNDYRHHQEYGQSEELSASQGALYSVSQRVPTVSTSYSSLCPTNNDNNNGTLVRTHHHQEWVGAKDSKSDILSDRQTSDTNTVGSVPSSIASTTAIATTNSTQQLQNSVLPTCVYLHNHIAAIMEIEDLSNANCDTLLQAIINCDEIGLVNKPLAMQIFALWMTSPLLELQLKPNHRPYDLRQNWHNLIRQYSHASFNRQQRDEPKVIFQRNVFFPQHLEEKIKDQKILEALYEEARHNILAGRYICEPSHYIMLGGIQARIELGPYNQQVHTTHYFREQQHKYLPIHIRKSSTWTWLPISGKSSAEVRLLEQYKRIPITATNRKLIKKYLEFCWSLPFYGAAFFQGQIEQPVRGLLSLMTHQDNPVYVAINYKGVYIIDSLQFSLLLSLRFDELSWEYARPSKEDNPNCLPCLFLQFMMVENSARVSKILQVFSKQASLMDTLITCFVNQIKAKTNDETDKIYENQITDNDIRDSSLTMVVNNVNNAILNNKLSKLTLATFDEDGHCIRQMGSWSFSY